MIYTAPLWLIFAILAWWIWLDPVLLGPPMRVLAEPEIVQGEARPGERVRIRWRWQVLRDCPRDVELHMVNGRTFILHQHHGTSGSSRRERNVLTDIRIPRDVTPGPATLRSVAHFRCTPLTTQTVRMEAPITILAAPPKETEEL